MKFNPFKINGKTVSKEEFFSRFRSIDRKSVV